MRRLLEDRRDSLCENTEGTLREKSYFIIVKSPCKCFFFLIPNFILLLFASPLFAGQTACPLPCSLVTLLGTKNFT